MFTFNRNLQQNTSSNFGLYIISDHTENKIDSESLMFTTSHHILIPFESLVKKALISTYRISKCIKVQKKKVLVRKLAKLYCYH